MQVEAMGLLYDQCIYRITTSLNILEVFMTS
jgi:hypothetical protein